MYGIRQVKIVRKESMLNWGEFKAKQAVGGVAKCTYFVYFKYVRLSM